MEQIEEIRRAYYQGHKSIRAIAREQGHGRDVIRAAIAGTEPGPPRYRLRHPKPQPVREAIAPVVDAWLTAGRAAPRKQRHTATRVYQRLIAEHGYTGSERTPPGCCPARAQDTQPPLRLRRGGRGRPAGWIERLAHVLLNNSNAA